MMWMSRHESSKIDDKPNHDIIYGQICLGSNLYLPTMINEYKFVSSLNKSQPNDFTSSKELNTQ